MTYARSIRSTEEVWSQSTQCMTCCHEILTMTRPTTLATAFSARRSMRHRRRLLPYIACTGLINRVAVSGNLDIHPGKRCSISNPAPSGF